MAFCSNCGSKLSENDKFCESCGHSIGTQKFIENQQTIKMKEMKNNIFSFEGQISRKPYNVIFTIVILFAIITFNIIDELARPWFWEKFGFSETQYLNTIYSILILTLSSIMLVCLFVLIAQSVKRCRDTGRSLWFLLIPVVSILYLFFMGSKTNENSSPIKPKDGAGLR